MSKLKEKFGKYFQFKNTINGTDYFLRGLFNLVFLIPIVIFVGVGVALITTNAVLAGLLVGIGCGFLVPLIWFSLATIYKRINAFFPNKTGWLVAATFIYSFILEGFNPLGGINVESGGGDWSVYVILSIPYLAWSLYLLFGNSKVKKHIG